MATAKGSLVEASSFDSRPGNPALHAGYIKRVDMSKFPTAAHGAKSVILSPRGEQVTILHMQEGGPPVVLLAIQAALGFPLSRLKSRGMNIEESLFRVDKATIRVTFMNQGPNAFEPYLYGRHVIVERSFISLGSSHGRNVVRMANENGDVVAIGEASLSRMLQHFNIILDNLVVDDERAKTVLITEPDDLYFIFRQIHQLEASVTETEEEVSLRNNRSLLEQELIKKKHAALKLKQEMEQLQNKSREWGDCICEIRLQYYLACYRKFRNECTRAEELFVQWQWRRTKAKEKLDMTKELCTKHRRQTEELSSCAKSTEIKDKLWYSATQKHIAKCCLEQVQNEIVAARKEVSRLKLALIYAKREAFRPPKSNIIRSSTGKAAAGTKAEPERTTTNMVALDTVAKKNSQIVKKSGLDEQQCPPAQRFLSEQEIVASAKEIGQQFLPRDLVTDITKTRLHLARIEKQEKELTERVKKHELDVANLMSEPEAARASNWPQQVQETKRLEQGLRAIDTMMARLEASIKKLQGQCKESLHAAKEHSVRPGHETHTENKDLLVLVDQGVAKEDPEVYKTKLEQAMDMAARYTSLRQEIEAMRRKSEHLSSRERAIVCDRIQKRAQLERQGQAVDCSFRNLIRLQYVEGKLAFDHEREKTYLMGAHPVGSKYWAISFLFALLNTSCQPFSMWLDCDETVVASDRGYYLNVLISNAIEVKQTCQSIIVTTQPVPPSNPCPTEVHTVDLTNYVDLTQTSDNRDG